jgi:hypothetical protein
MKGLFLVFIRALLFNTNTLTLYTASPRQINKPNKHQHKSIPYILDKTVTNFRKRLFGSFRHIIVKIANNNDVQIKLTQSGRVGTAFRAHAEPKPKCVGIIMPTLRSPRHLANQFKL